MTMTLHYSSSNLQWLLLTMSCQCAWQQPKVTFLQQLKSGSQDGVIFALTVSELHNWWTVYLIPIFFNYKVDLSKHFDKSSSPQWVCRIQKPCRRCSYRSSVTQNAPNLMTVTPSQKIWYVPASLRGARTHARQVTIPIISFLVTVQCHVVEADM